MADAFLLFYSVVDHETFNRMDMLKKTIDKQFGKDKKEVFSNFVFEVCWGFLTCVLTYLLTSLFAYWLYWHIYLLTYSECLLLKSVIWKLYLNTGSQEFFYCWISLTSLLIVLLNIFGVGCYRKNVLLLLECFIEIWFQVPIVVLGNMIDLPGRKVDSEFAQSWAAKERGLSFDFYDVILGIIT